MFSQSEMTPGHPEASGLSGCLGKLRTHLMTQDWSVSHRFFYPGLRMGNDNGLVNYCAARPRAHIRQGALFMMKRLGRGEKKVQSYREVTPLVSQYDPSNTVFRHLYFRCCSTADLYAS